MKIITTVGSDNSGTDFAIGKMGQVEGDLFFASPSESSYKLLKSTLGIGLVRPIYGTIDCSMDNGIVQSEQRAELRQQHLELELQTLAKITKYTAGGT